jgi:prepilin-type N-terminal cleavage/methylation domain-containing protein
MNMKLRSEKKKGFTLIELLVVITIIGILAGIAIGPMGDILFNTSKTAASKNLKGMWDKISTNNGDLESFKWPGKETINSAQGFATWFTKKTAMDDAAIWFLSKDPILEEFDDGDGPKIPERITNKEGSLDDVKDAFGYSMAVPPTRSRSIPESPSGPFPLMWTRGLESGATEWSKESPWEGSGGHILFSNGKVEWYDNTEGEEQEGVFKTYREKGDDQDDTLTTDIKQAIPDDWEILQPDG